MVCMRVTSHEDEDNSDSYKQGVECWIRGHYENHGNDENHGNHGNPRCKPRVPQTTGFETPDNALATPDKTTPLLVPEKRGTSPKHVSVISPRHLWDVL